MENLFIFICIDRSLLILKVIFPATSALHFNSCKHRILPREAEIPMHKLNSMRDSQFNLINSLSSSNCSTICLEVERTENKLKQKCSPSEDISFDPIALFLRLLARLYEKYPSQGLICSLFLQSPMIKKEKLNPIKTCRRKSKTK